MLEIYLLKNKSPNAARREYMRRFPNRRVPFNKIFRRHYQKLLENGSLQNIKKENINVPVLTQENQINILGYFEANPLTSISRVNEETGISCGSIHKVLKKFKYKAFKFKNTQKLNEDQRERRLHFSQEFLTYYNENNEFLRNILWTDESSFSTRRGSNRQNTRFWSTNNPRQIRQIKHQGYQTVNVWCGIIGRYILGPIFINGKLTGDRYLQLLQNDIGDCIDNLPLSVVRRIKWQQDGAPPHNVGPVQHYLNSEYPQG